MNYFCNNIKKRPSYIVDLLKYNFYFLKDLEKTINRELNL